MEANSVHNKCRGKWEEEMGSMSKPSLGSIGKAQALEANIDIVDIHGGLQEQ